jgi:hypothetical protein
MIEFVDDRVQLFLHRRELMQTMFDRLHGELIAIVGVGVVGAAGRRGAVDGSAGRAVAAAHAALIDGGGAVEHAEAVAAGGAVALAHVAHVVLIGAVRHAGAVGARLGVARAHVARVVHGAAVRHALAVLARRRVAVAHVARIVHRNRREVVLAVAARLVVAAAHVAQIVLVGAVRHAAAVLARLGVAVAHVALIVLARTVRYAVAVGARRVVAAAHAALVARRARERHCHERARVGKRILADTVVLKRAAKRQHVHLPRLRRVDRRHAKLGAQLIEADNRPLEVGAGLRHDVVVGGRMREHRIGGAQHEALARLAVGHCRVPIQAEAGGVERRAARQPLAVAALLGRIADYKVHYCVELAAALAPDVDRQRKRLGRAKLGQIDAAPLRQLGRRAVRIAITIRIT